MRNVYVWADSDGFITSLSEYWNGPGSVEVQVEDAFDVLTIGDYRLKNNTLTYTGECTQKNEELKQQAEINKRVQEASIAYFENGGKESMEQDIIEAAQSSSEPDTALTSFVSLTLPLVAPTVSDSNIVSVIKYAPNYVPEGKLYKKGEVFKYTDGTYWRVSQEFTSQAQWVPGQPGLDALFYNIHIAPDGIIVWEQPRGEFDAPDKGDKRHYPNEDSPIYVSKVNDNAYSPDTYPDNWELEQD